MVTKKFSFLDLLCNRTIDQLDVIQTKAAKTHMGTYTAAVKSGATPTEAMQVADAKMTKRIKKLVK